MASTKRTPFEVVLDASELGARATVGTLYRTDARTDVPASFEYERTWLASENAFMLDPRLELWGGEQHPPSRSTAFGVFMDSAPDRWGRVLMERREAAQARRERRKVRSLSEIDFLLGVHDVTRTGALRFRADAAGPFLDDSKQSVPPITSLRELEAISQKIEEPDAETLPEYDRWLAMLVAPGSSLGGARPKANFIDNDGALWIAKFPSRADRYDVGAWELLVHRLAHDAGVRTPRSRLETLGERHRTFCVERFDRAGANRRMFSSAMTLLERKDGDDASYLDLAQFIADHGARNHIDDDLEQLFLRVVFNVLVGNRDDHLRNHGFLREPSGWRLAPAYDMNASPATASHTLSLDGATREPDIDAVLETADLYRLSDAAARRVVKDTRDVVGSWREAARDLALPKAERMLMERAFG